ncbi:tRNA pseudouridine synthase 4 [Cladobotryum mycophilum]|uniref:tRNA pseudouridine(55) synthase n=1 Tax=Cladobotryum mycophilum TaxID=491253 RepID=A0ABR0SMG4_9HYPO
MTAEIVREGVFAINKPCGLSSAQVLRECQHHFNPSAFFKPMIEAEVAKRLKESGGQFMRRKAEKKATQVKIGHGGTLDPLATGVLIMGIGSATKVLNQFLECTKTYETTIVFGASTDTYDRVGRVLTRRPYDHITKEMVEKELDSFRGKQMQIPPLYSALKMNGKPLYEYAREGKPIPREIKGREVDVLELELVEWYEPKSHNHRWPTEEAEAAERNLAEQVWRIKKQQETSRKLTPEEKEQDDQAVAAHETFKRKFEERQDELIKDAPKKKQKHPKQNTMMSGALGQLPQPIHSSRGKNLVPDSPDESTPPPWSDEGPPACKIRMKVTSGFYVRSFCHDLGAKLGSAGLMAELCRVRQSDFTVGGTNCLEYDDLAKGEEVWGPKVADMLARWNGEPHGEWPGTQASGSSQQPPKKQDNKSANPGQSPPRTEKRSRSPDGEHKESPPRKVHIKESIEGDEPVKEVLKKTNGTKRVKHEEWNGFDD